MYSQNKEDDYYSEYLDLNKKDGKYVDIGAGDPQEYSNTYFLYTLGWRGLCVEPYPYKDKDKLWAEDRPRDILINSAIMSTEGNFNMCDSVIEGSWLYDDYVYNKNRPISKIQGITLAILLEKYPDFYDADLFSIDVELHEASVLSTADFNKFTPKLIIIEKCVRDVDMKPAWEHLLLPFYTPVKEFPGNTFYLRKV